MFPWAFCLFIFPDARFEFPEATDIHHFGSNENPKYPNYYNYVSDSLVSKCGSGVCKHKGSKAIKKCSLNTKVF